MLGIGNDRFDQFEVGRAANIEGVLGALHFGEPLRRSRVVNLPRLPKGWLQPSVSLVLWSPLLGRLTMPIEVLITCFGAGNISPLFLHFLNLVFAWHCGSPMR